MPRASVEYRWWWAQTSPGVSAPIRPGPARRAAISRSGGDRRERPADGVEVERVERRKRTQLLPMSSGATRGGAVGLGTAPARRRRRSTVEVQRVVAGLRGEGGDAERLAVARGGVPLERELVADHAPVHRLDVSGGEVARGRRRGRPARPRPASVGQLGQVLADRRRRAAEPSARWYVAARARLSFDHSDVSLLIERLKRNNMDARMRHMHHRPGGVTVPAAIEPAAALRASVLRMLSRTSDARLRADRRARGAHRRALEAEPRLHVPHPRPARGRGPRASRPRTRAASATSSPMPGGPGSTSTPTRRRRPPWERAGLGGRGDLRRLGGEIFGQLRQLGRFGSPAQLERAQEILKRTRAELYAVLANPPADDTILRGVVWVPARGERAAVGSARWAGVGTAPRWSRALEAGDRLRSATRRRRANWAGIVPNGIWAVPPSWRTLCPSQSARSGRF